MLSGVNFCFARSADRRAYRILILRQEREYILFQMRGESRHRKTAMNFYTYAAELSASPMMLTM